MEDTRKEILIKMYNHKIIYILEMINKNTKYCFGVRIKTNPKRYVIGAFTNADEAFEARDKYMRKTKNSVDKYGFRTTVFVIDTLIEGELKEIDKSKFSDGYIVKK